MTTPHLPPFSQRAKESPEESFFAVVGLTASGKGRLARMLAKTIDAEILSVDSMKVYRRLDIGTAKPTPEERAVVPHHLLDLVDPDQTYSVARFREDAIQVEAAVQKRGRVPLYVGGTALYLKVLRHGLFPEPGRDPTFRATLQERAEREGSSVVHAWLRRVDPVSAARIHPHDRKRIIRALEVYHVTGRPISDWQQEFEQQGRPVCWVGVRWSRVDLHERIHRRVERMMAAGFRAEVEALEADGSFGPTSQEAIGYRELLAHLRGEKDHEETVEAIKARTRQFAHRQATWFRSFPDIHWLDVDASTDWPKLVDSARRVMVDSRP